MPRLPENIGFRLCSIWTLEKERQIHHALIKISRLGPAACHPAREAIDHVEASPHAKAREPFLDGTSHAKLDRLSLGPRSWSTFGQTRVSMS